MNGAYRDETPIGKLMHDFSCTNPSDMYYGVLADRVRFFKESKEGITVMCKVMEDMRNEAAEEAELRSAKETAERLIKKGKMTLEEIAECVPLLSVDELREIEMKVMQLA